MIAGDARVWMESAAALAQVANREVRPRITEEIGDQLDDCNPPLPSLLVVFSRRDNIEACFDAVSVQDICTQAHSLGVQRSGSPRYAYVI